MTVDPKMETREVFLKWSPVDKDAVTKERPDAKQQLKQRVTASSQCNGHKETVSASSVMVRKTTNNGESLKTVLVTKEKEALGLVRSTRSFKSTHALDTCSTHKRVKEDREIFSLRMHFSNILSTF